MPSPEGKALIVNGCEACTVADLIRHLQQFPPETPVIYQCCSDWAALEVSDVRLSGEKELCHRTGGVRDTYPKEMWPKGEVPQYVTAVKFPGN